MTIVTVSAARILLLGVAAAVLAGCAGDVASTPPASAPTPSPTVAAPSATPAASLPSDAPAWLSTGLTDVRTGEEFTITGLGADLVVVHGMAQACPVCPAQASEIEKLLEEFGPDGGVVAVSLDIAAGEDASSLAAYAASGGYDWRFAVAPPQIVTEFGSLYGPQFTDPQSDPIVLVHWSGRVLALPPGPKSAENLKETIIGFMGFGFDGGL
jgi:hypothetical protein